MALQSVDARFDEATDTLVRSWWGHLSDAGLPSQGDHASESNAPHVTLSALPSVPASVDAGWPAVLDAAGGVPVECRLGPLVLLGGRRLVVARLVVAAPRLLRLQAAGHDALVAALDDEAADELPEVVRPGRWTPHVTLASGVHPEQLPDVLARLREVGAVGGSGGGGGGGGGAGVDVPARLETVHRWDPDVKRVWDVTASDQGGPAD